MLLVHRIVEQRSLDPGNNSQLSLYARASNPDLAEAAEAVSGVKGP